MMNATVSGVNGAHTGELARMLRELLAAKNMTPADLARQSGVSASQISRILNKGDGASPDNLSKLADALGVDPSVLHRAYAVQIGLQLDAVEWRDDTLEAVAALWPQLSEEARQLQLAQIEAFLRLLNPKD